MLVIKLIKTNIKFTVALLTSLVLNVSLPKGMPTFVIEALYLISNMQLVKCCLLLNEWLIQHNLSLL